MIQLVQGSFAVTTTAMLILSTTIYICYRAFLSEEDIDINLKQNVYLQLNP